MTTIQLLIICLTLLATTGIVTRSRRTAALKVADAELEAARVSTATAAAARELAATVSALNRVAGRLAPAPAPVGDRVTVHTRQPDDRTLTGVLVEEYRDRLVLADARYVTAQGSTAVPGGRASIPKANEAYRQEHGPAGELE